MSDDDGFTPVMIDESTLTHSFVTNLASQPSSRSNPGPRNNYSYVKLKYFLDLIEEILSIGPSEWNKVVETHVVNLHFESF